MPSEEVIILPMDLIYQSCDEGMSRMQSLVNARFDEYLPYALRRPLSLNEARWNAWQLYRDFGRAGREPTSLTIDRLVEAMEILQGEIYHVIARCHGISYQTVTLVRMIGQSSIVLRLVPMRIRISDPLPDDAPEDF